MPEPQNRALVRHYVIRQFHARESAHRLAVVDRILGLWVRQVEPDLQKIDPQHVIQPERLPPTTRFRVMRLDQTHQQAPRNDLIHLAQESLAPGHPPFVLPRQPCERLLLSHSTLLSLGVARSIEWNFVFHSITLHDL